MRRLNITKMATFVGLSLLSSVAPAQHLDVLAQSVDGKLATGSANFDSGSDTLGLRVFSRPFNSLYAVDNPGFNAIGSTTGTLPPGAQALPGNAALRWDFLPMKVDGGVSNLLYWNGAGTTPETVAFGLSATSTYSLSLFGANDLRAAADGTANIVPGNVIDTTAADGFIHEHRFWFLDNDLDDNNATVAADGVYMVALRLRMDALNRSDPFFVMFSSPSVSLATLGAADAWAQENVDQLTPNFDADFDGDLDVDGADFLTWQRGVGMSSALQVQGDADGDGQVVAADLAVWTAEFGQSLATFQGAATEVASGASSPLPEPAAGSLAAMALTVLAQRRRRRDHRRAGVRHAG